LAGGGLPFVVREDGGCDRCSYCQPAAVWGSAAKISRAR
jgi:hypothetical protein